MAGYNFSINPNVGTSDVDMWSKAVSIADMLDKRKTAQQNRAVQAYSFGGQQLQDQRDDAVRQARIAAEQNPNTVLSAADAQSQVLNDPNNPATQQYIKAKAAVADPTAITNAGQQAVDNMKATGSYINPVNIASQDSTVYPSLGNLPSQAIAQKIAEMKSGTVDPLMMRVPTLADFGGNVSNYIDKAVGVNPLLTSQIDAAQQQGQDAYTQQAQSQVDTATQAQQAAAQQLVAQSQATHDAFKPDYTNANQMVMNNAAGNPNDAGVEEQAANIRMVQAATQNKNVIDSSLADLAKSPLIQTGVGSDGKPVYLDITPQIKELSGLTPNSFVPGGPGWTAYNQLMNKVATAQNTYGKTGTMNTDSQRMANVLTANNQNMTSTIKRGQNLAYDAKEDTINALLSRGVITQVVAENMKQVAMADNQMYAGKELAPLFKQVDDLRAKGQGITQMQKGDLVRLLTRLLTPGSGIISDAGRQELDNPSMGGSYGKAMQWLNSGAQGEPPVLPDSFYNIMVDIAHRTVDQARQNRNELGAQGHNMALQADNTGRAARVYDESIGFSNDIVSPTGSTNTPALSPKQASDSNKNVIKATPIVSNPKEADAIPAGQYFIANGKKYKSLGNGNHILAGK